MRILLSHLYSRDFSGLRETSVISRNLILQQTTCLISCTVVQHQCFISCTVVQHQCFISCTVVQHQCLISCTVVQHQCLISCTVVKQDTNILLLQCLMLIFNSFIIFGPRTNVHFQNYFKNLTY